MPDILPIVRRIRDRHGRVGMLELRESLNLPRSWFDNEVIKAWRQGKITLSAPERQLNDAQRAACVEHAGERLYWVEESMR